MKSMKRQKDRTLKDELPRSIGAQYATGEKWRNNSRMNRAKQKKHPEVDVTGDGNKVQCCEEQYCIGTWNVRSMNQSKLEVVKQEMARVNIDILGISELKWTTWVNLTQMTIISTIVSKTQKKWSSHHSQQKSLKCSTWMQSQKQQNDICLFPSKPSNITVIQVYAPTSNAEVAEVEQF